LAPCCSRVSRINSAEPAIKDGWIDRTPASAGLYWLEDVDVNGTRTIHRPVPVEANAALP